MKKVPLSLKEAKRTRRTSRTKDEPIPDDDEIIPPEGMTREAVKVWAKQVPRLRAMGILGNPDVDALSMYCQYYADWMKYMKQLNKEGMVIKTKKQIISPKTKRKTTTTEYTLNPLYHLTNKRFEQCMKLQAQFGMNPVARVGLKSSGKVDKPKKSGFNDLD